MTRRRIPIACTLTRTAATDQVGEWKRLRGEARSIGRLGDGGVVMIFDPALRSEVEDLAAREATCCAFLTLSTSSTADELRLEITSDQDGAEPVLDLLAGSQFQAGSGTHRPTEAPCS